MTVSRLSLREVAFWALALPLAFLASWSLGAGPSQETGRPLADTGGAIEAMIVHFTPQGADAVMPTYVDLFRGLPATTRVTVAVPSAAAFQAFLAGMRAGGVGDLERFEALVTDREITVWSRDRFLPLSGDPRDVLVVPAQPTDDTNPARQGDWFVPHLLADAARDRLLIRQLPLRFDGGDFVVTDTTLFATAALLGRNIPEVFPTREALVAWLEDFSGLRVELIGDAPEDVPEHHIGMILTPLPDGRVVVADARRTPADIDAARTAGLPAAQDEDLARRCDHVAAWLTARGYDVVRMPLIPTGLPKAWMTYNNIVFEQRAGAWRVFMPIYGAPAQDAAAQAAWEALGAEVIAVDVRGVFLHRGSVRCLTQILRRHA